MRKLELILYLACAFSVGAAFEAISIGDHPGVNAIARAKDPNSDAILFCYRE